MEAPTQTLAPSLAQRRAASAAHDKLHARLVALGNIVGVSPAQVSLASRERAADAYQHPATEAQRVEAAELAARLEASLPNHSGTALVTRAQLVMFLLDPAGAGRLTIDLRAARFTLGE